MSYSPVGDTVALTKLAYNVYNKVYTVARDAPQQFAELSQDLKIFKAVLHHINKQLVRDTDQQYGAPVKDVLERCFRTLRGLRELTSKYENLGWSDRGHWSKRLQFAADQGAIREFRARFRDDQQLLQLILTPSGRQRLDEHAENEKASLRHRKTTVIGAPNNHDKCLCEVRSPQKATRMSTADSHTLYDPRDSVSLASPTLSPGSHKKPSTRTLSMDTATALESDTMRSLSLAQRSMSIVTSDSTYSARGESLDKIRSDDTQADIRTETSLDSDFQEESSICSPMSTTEKPLILAAKRAKHDVGDRLEHILRASFAPVAEEYPTESILRLAIWWLLKARIVRKLLMQNGALRRKTDASLHEDAWESTISAEQAHADLLKASWILEEGVLANADDRALTYTNIRRIIKNIAASVHQDLSLRRDPDPVLPPLGEEGILKHDLALLESFEQNIEAEENVPNAIDDDVTGFRWMEIDQDNAGLLHERVKYRTFVNAQIGSRNDRLKSSSAPYMLLLWTTAEESDLMVSLCNQRGTVNLSRRLTAEDLEKYDSLAELKPFVFDFPSQDAEIMFLTTQDFLDFLKLPKSFYEKMRERGPRSEELAIFQATLSTYADISGQRHPSDDQAQSLAGDKHSSCGLRLYESISDKCWKTTRRLVISASPNSPNVRCVSHWLPLENVRITTTDAKVTVAWSDCAQLTPKSKGNYDEHFAYEYRAEEPNRKIHLKFRHSSDAQEFAETLLYPTELPPQVIIKSEIATNFSNTRIYRLFDTDEPNQQYHAIVSTRRSPKGPHCTEIFYTYRDLDWTLQTKSSASMPSAIAFERLQTAHHISTITRTQAKPAPGDPSPEFASTTESSKRAHLELACDHDLANLIRGVFGWQLAVYLPVPKLVLIDTSRLLRNTKEALRNVAVQLYRKSAEQGPPHVQLAVRLEGKVKDRWITMVLAENSYKSDYHTFEIGGVAVRRGVEVDTKYMCATKKGAETGRVPRGPWKVAITFESSSDKDEFMRNSGLQSTMRLD